MLYLEVTTENAKETKTLGRKIANNLVSNKQHIGNKATVLALTGDLGSGKTTFVQGLVKGLGIKQRIVSPTFIIMRTYRINLKPQTLNFKTLHHIDLYRLEDKIEAELKNLGIEEIFSDQGNLVVIEWAEKMKDFLPADTIWIKFGNIGEDQRKIVYELKS